MKRCIVVIQKPASASHRITSQYYSVRTSCASAGSSEASERGTSTKCECLDFDFEGSESRDGDRWAEPFVPLLSFFVRVTVIL